MIFQHYKLILWHSLEEHTDFVFSQDSILSGSADINLNEINPSLSDDDAQTQLQKTNDEELQQCVDIFSKPALIEISSQPAVAFSVKTIPKLVVYSEANKYFHVKSGMTGNFNILFSFDGKKKH